MEEKLKNIANELRSIRICFDGISSNLLNSEFFTNQLKKKDKIKLENYDNFEDFLVDYTKETYQMIFDTYKELTKEKQNK